MSSQMDVSDILRMNKRLRTKNEADSLKIKQRRSSTEKDVDSLGLKEELERDWFVEDEENDGTGYVEDDDEQDVDGDNDEEGGEEDEGRYDEDEGGDVEDEGDEEEDRNHLRRQVTHGFHLVKGKMDHPMEDCVVATNRKVIGHDVGLYAIFDGHSGHKVAEYLQSHLFDRILNERDFRTSSKEAIKRAYRDTDDEILDSVVGSRGGSTAVTAILVDGEKLIVANVGDSRAILCRNGEAKQVTVDHEPQKEKQQVESRGGFVSQMPGNVPRVDGQLAMARAFGDERLKEHITAEPDIFVETIDANTDFIILASDGVWKVMSNQEAADSIKGLSDSQEASKELIKEALSRKSRDDISCIVVMFS